MPKGIALPFAATPGGGFRTSEGDEQDHKIISSALSDLSSDNPFQQNLGLGPSPIFQIADSTSRADIMLRLRAIFDEFSAARRYDLIEDSVQVQTPDQEGATEGEYVVSLRYLSIEANEERVFSQAFRSSAAGQGV